MATIDGYAWTTIGDGSIDADSPFDDTLSTDIRDNIENLMRWLGKDYLSGAVANHDHDGANSAKIAGASGGVGIAVVPYQGTGQSVKMDYIRFKPEWCWFTHIVDTSSGAPNASPFMKSVSMAAQSTYNFNDGLLASHGADAFYEGGVGQDGAAASLSTSTTIYDRLMLKSVSGLIHVGGYTGTGSTQSITAPGFQPTLVWVVRRATSGVTTFKISDYSPATNSKDARAGTFSTTAITSLDSTGFTLGTSSDVNGSAVTYDYLALKAGTSNGERIAKLNWTGDNVDGRAITGAGFRAQAALVFRTNVTTNNNDWIQTASQTRHGAQRWGVAALQDGIQTFDSDGITVDANMNATGSSYTAFLFLGGTRFTPR